MIPPESEPQHSNDKQPSSRARGRGRGRGRGQGRGPSREPKIFFCHFHGSDSDHRTNQCPEKKKTLDRMESEKKAKLVGHTTWPQTPQTQSQQIQYTQPSFIPPPYLPKHTAHPCLTTTTITAGSRSQTLQRKPSNPQPKLNPLRSSYRHPQLTHQNKKTKPQIANPRHYHPSA